MKNSDMPAMPIGLDAALRYEEGHYYEASLGLTKREHAAIKLMAGILANRNYEAPRRERLAGMAIEVVSAADALLAELAKPTGVNDGE